MILNPKAEMLPKEMREQLIWERLRKNLKWAYEKSAFYREKYTKANVELDDIKSLADIKKLPLTTFEELKNASAFDMMTGPMSGTVRFNKTLSGLYRGFTMDDIRRSLEVAVRPLAANDINKSSTVVLCGDYSSQYLLDVHYSAEALGATVIPCRDAAAARDAISIFRANTLIATAARLKEIIDGCADLAQLPDKIIMLADETHIQLMTWVDERLNKFAPKVFMAKNLGVTGLIFTCEQQKYHIQDDYFYPEIENGQLILTALTFEAMPIIRLHTGKAAELGGCSCGCGRTFTIVDIL